MKLFTPLFIEPEHIETGLDKAYWPGRFEILQEEPTVIIDGAHNREGIIALVETVQRHYSNPKGKVLFAALKDKETDEMVRELSKLGMEIVFTEFDFYRVKKAAELNGSVAEGKVEIETDWRHFIEKTLPNLKEEDMLLITGSIYFISQVKPFFENFAKN